MKSTFVASIPVIVVLFTLNACVQNTSLQNTPHWDSQFGDSVRLAVARQTMNPDAGQKEVSESVDGNAAKEAVGRYRNSFKEPQQNTNNFVIGVSR